MPRGTLFWVIAVVAFLFSCYSGFMDRNSLRSWGGVVLVLWILVMLLGWSVYGPVVR